jgi:hypothetical protein
MTAIADVSQGNLPSVGRFSHRSFRAKFILVVGAAVLFNGIRVGEVTELGLAPGNPRGVNATTRAATSLACRHQGGLERIAV